MTTHTIIHTVVYKQIQSPDRRISQIKTNTPAGKEITMSSHNEHNYIESDEERESGHEDTRHLNFECESFDSIGCDTGVDVAG